MPHDGNDDPLIEIGYLEKVRLAELVGNYDFLFAEGVTIGRMYGKRYAVLPYSGPRLDEVVRSRKLWIGDVLYVPEGWWHRLRRRSRERKEKRP